MGAAAWAVLLGGLLATPGEACAQGRNREDRGGGDRTVVGPEAAVSVVLGRPTDHSATLSVLSASTCEAYVEFGPDAGHLNQRTPTKTVQAGTPTEFELAGLPKNAACGYRVCIKKAGDREFARGEARSIRTQRAPGGSFTFAVQGDSHPERVGRMFDAGLYVRTLQNVRSDAPDFYFLMGDDFSIERLIERGTLKQEAVNGVYALQRGFLGIVGASSALFLVNGNHEQAAKYLLNGSPENFAVFAGKARLAYFPLPAPGGIYSGNSEPVEHVGLPRDYYAFEWGDALFVVIDPYWHSEMAVDNEAGTRAPDRREGGAGGGEQPRKKGEGGKGQRDLWNVTLGDAQYRWLSTTLRQSTAKFKFVFSHHVMGTGRGAVELAGMYEWGGEDRRGVDRFFQMRPTWEQPIHDLMRDAGVTIFFQGHDHLYAHQTLDGVVYQTCPNPADPTFTAFNKEAYRSGDIFPNSGHLRVTVTGGDQASCKVEYVRSFRPEDEAREGAKNGTIQHSYTVTPRLGTLTPRPGSRPNTKDTGK